MNKYGQIAINAARLCHKATISPASAWRIEAEKIFKTGSASAIKGCPKNTFLGLCEDGLVKGVKPGNYTKSEANKSYALKAIELLREKPKLVENKLKLWKMIVGESKAHNSQMDVVVALYEEKLIESEK